MYEEEDGRERGKGGCGGLTRERRGGEGSREREEKARGVRVEGDERRK